MQSQSYTERLGHNTWQFLSTMIEGYPDKPTPRTQAEMSQFITLLASLYPCSKCRNEFQEYVSQNKPRTGSREELYQYLYIQRYLTDTEKFFS